MENLTPKQLKLAVTHDCARDPSLADKIAFIVGFEPRWSQMSVTQMAQVQSAWEMLIKYNESKQGISGAAGNI